MHSKNLRAYLDSAAGIAASLFPITYADLLRATGATEVEVD